MVPRAGVEPAHPKIQDFESSASANSAIWAYPRFGNKASCPLNARIRFWAAIYVQLVLKRKSVVDLKVSPAFKIAPPISG